jgi:hypothetical protein
MAGEIEERTYRWPRRYVFATALVAIAVLIWWLLP